MLTNKYLYYKKKYLEYKTKRILFPLTPLGEIKELFIKCQLTELITRVTSEELVVVPLAAIEQEQEQRRSSRIEQQASSSSSSAFSSPAPHMIYNPSTSVLFTRRTLESIREELEKDDAAINKIVVSEEGQDKDYMDYDKDYGKTIEIWYADTQTCPCCGSNSLRRYSSNIFPIIDLVCVNLEHPVNKVRFFQVKTSNGSLFREDKYFNIDSTTNTGHIYTGSRKAGNPIHVISGSSSPHDKFFAIGYICISIEHFGPDDSNFVISKIDIVLPDLDKSDGQYYSYLDNPADNPYNKPKISWNPNNMMITSSQGRIRVPRDYLSTQSYQIIDNPLKDLELTSDDFESE